MVPVAPRRPVALMALMAPVVPMSPSGPSGPNGSKSSKSLKGPKSLSSLRSPNGPSGSNRLNGPTTTARFLFLNLLDASFYRLTLSNSDRRRSVPAVRVRMVGWMEDEGGGAFSLSRPSKSDESLAATKRCLLISV